MQSEFYGDDFLFECPVSTCTPHLIKNSVELQIVNDLEDRYRPCYKPVYVLPSRQLRRSRYVSDRQGNNYVTLKVSSNIRTAFCAMYH
jgi:predicted nucleotide-binding protein (sugar kinase/HSP70/actin superfamily)